MNETELLELLERVRGKDKAAFVALYGEMKRPIYTVVLRIVQNKECAEDVTHDLFLQLFVEPPDSSVKNPRAWIFRTARNLAIDALRKKGGEELQEESAVTNDADEAISLQLDIKTAFGRLSSVERQIVSLHANGGLGFAEIGKIVGLSLPATYRRYQKAVKTLRDFLNGDKV